MTASATFRLGTSASPTGPWTWGAYDAAVVANAGDYCKIQLQSTSGVDAIAVTIPTADPNSLAAGVPAVTVDQSAKTATFRTLSAVGQSLCVQVTALSGGTIAGTSGLQVNVLTCNGSAALAVGETTQYHRTYGFTSKLNSVIAAPVDLNVQAFGAVGDGVHDDTLAIQATIAAAESSAFGACVYFPPGTYLNTATIALVSGRVRLRGTPESSRLLYSGTGAAIEIGATGTLAQGVSVRDMVVQGGASCLYGVAVICAYKCSFDHVRVTSALDAAWGVNFAVLCDWRNCGFAEGAERPLPVNGLVVNSTDVVYGTSGQNCFYNFYVSGATGDGIVIGNASYTLFYSGSSEDNGGRGMVLLSTSSSSRVLDLHCEMNNLPSANSIDFEDSGTDNRIEALSYNLDASAATRPVIIGGLNPVGLRLLRGSNIPSPSGGSVVDVESRLAVREIINRLKYVGFSGESTDFYGYDWDMSMPGVDAWSISYPAGGSAPAPILSKVAGYSGGSALRIQAASGHEVGAWQKDTLRYGKAFQVSFRVKGDGAHSWTLRDQGGTVLHTGTGYENWDVITLSYTVSTFMYGCFMWVVQGITGAYVDVGAVSISLVS